MCFKGAIVPLKTFSRDGFGLCLAFLGKYEDVSTRQRLPGIKKQNNACFFDQVAEELFMFGR